MGRSLSPISETVPAWWLTVATLLGGCALTASVVSTWLSERAWATLFLSPPSWEWLAQQWTGRPFAGVDQMDVAYLPVFIAVLLIAAITWLGGALRIARRQGVVWTTALRQWGFRGWIWWCGLGLWEWVWTATAASGLDGAATLLVGSIPFWTAVCLAGWLTTGHVLAESSGMSTREQAASGRCSLSVQSQPLAVWLWILAAFYTAVFVTLNWRLWFNLYIPHGDSAMYEEHLWNLLHGKGFRSYLDQGLFLGEHIQVVHLGLLPLYLLWPSHLLLELCESLALALGVFPVAWMMRRHTESNQAACCAAAAYLLYFPMQFLDIEIDLKTFRPEAFGIPVLLLTLDQLDRRSWRGFFLGVLGCLTVKEDYALVLGPLGVWLAITELRCDRKNSPRQLRVVLLGAGLAVGSVVYLWLATRVVMPWFRSGEEIHYARYFSRFGGTPEEIVGTLLTRPWLVAQELFGLSTWLYALALLVPVAGLALWSPGRLAVGLPLFGVLCLNELARDPRHHFHAPLVAIVFWATAAGLAHVKPLLQWLQSRFSRTPQQPVREARGQATSATACHALWITSLCTGLFFSLGPLGLAFWDPGSNWYWWTLYGPTNRGAAFARIAPLIPMTARVSSTDFVHPRFTHHARSYDYSGYERRVGRVPDDTDFIVIDTTHRYSTMHHPNDVPEYHQPDRWELVPDETGGMFIVLRRRQ